MALFEFLSVAVSIVLALSAGEILTNFRYALLVFGVSSLRLAAGAR